MEKQLLLVVDFGAHNNQKVAKIARSLNIYCEVVSSNIGGHRIKDMKAHAIAFIGDNEVISDDIGILTNELANDNAPILLLANEKTDVELKEFFFEDCAFSGDWTIDKFIDDAVEKIREQVKGKKILCALSGGVDSSVCAALVHKACGDNLICMFVDHGLMRKGEPAMVEKIFGEQFQMNLISIDAKDRFLGKLDGVSDPERKRKIIGEEFIRVFEEESAKIGDIEFLVQGTIYPDIIESISNKGVVKSHHNVGGLPDDFKFELVEPVKWLFKDEVRAVGIALGLPKEQVWRQPFPGPGLGVRVIGAITNDRLETVRESDAILREEIDIAGLTESIWQFFTLNPGCKSTGVKDEVRTFEEVIVIRAINSVDAMSADVIRLPYELLDKIALRIVKEVKGVNRVLYDVTPKPPATIEWE